VAPVRRELIGGRAEILVKMSPRRWIVAGLFVALTVAGFAFRPLAQVRDHDAVDWADGGARAGGDTYVPADPSNPPAARLAAVGDVGTGDHEEAETAATMASLPGRPYDGLLLLGDNVYPAGDPARLPATVFEPFAAILDDGTDLLAALGNHDVKNGNAAGQVDALGMPGRWYAWRSGPALVVVLDSTRSDDPAQRAWLQDTLSTTDAPWRIVALHHPPYSAGWHGSAEDVRAAFEPLFTRYRVQLVLAGHDHDYQRSESIDGTTYVVSGAGAKIRPTSRASFTAVSWSTQHFVDLQIWPDRLIGQAVAQDGLAYDRFELRP
jgi:hypothetical protein